MRVKRKQERKVFGRQRRSKGFAALQLELFAQFGVGEYRVALEYGARNRPRRSRWPGAEHDRYAVTGELRLELNIFTTPLGEPRHVCEERVVVVQIARLQRKRRRIDADSGGVEAEDGAFGDLDAERPACERRRFGVDAAAAKTAFAVRLGDALLSGVVGEQLESLKVFERPEDIPEFVLFQNARAAKGQGLERRRLVDGIDKPDR